MQHQQPDPNYSLGANYIKLNGDTLSPETGIIVHGCNCQGVMGAGIAAQVRSRYPAAYEIYVKKHRISGLKLGEITYAEVAPNKIIVNANTQFSCGVDRRYVDYEAVATCFEAVKILARSMEGPGHEKLDIVFPMIGAGLAGGNWKIIETIILETIGNEFRKILYVFP